MFFSFLRSIINFIQSVLLIRSDKISVKYIGLEGNEYGQKNVLSIHRYIYIFQYNLIQ